MVNTSFVSGLSLDFNIFAVTSAIEGELSDITEELYLFERVPAMLKKLKSGDVASDQIIALMRLPINNMHLNIRLKHESLATAIVTFFLERDNPQTGSRKHETRDTDVQSARKLYAILASTCMLIPNCTPPAEPIGYN